MIDEIKRNNLNIIVIGITNYPNVLDPALKRAGRLGRQIEVPYLTKNKSKWEKDQQKESFIRWTSDFWSQVHEITQEAFEKCRQKEIGISYTDLEMSIKDAVAKKVSESSKEVIPQSSDFKKELDKKSKW